MFFHFFASSFFIPPIYGIKTLGIKTEPSFCWCCSISATIVLEVVPPAGYNPEAATEEASAATIRESPYLEPGTTRAVLVAPLSFFKEDPQVVVFTADSEQVMWLLYAVNYDRGGRQELPQSGGALGGCADITAFPILTGEANITFLGLGCRIKAAVDPCHLMMGVPGGAMAGLHAHILELTKPIGMLKKARGGG